tara:strand:- start:5482 stop:5625 length:144 start_codon:yes stop_codon:yes gene_type:complete
METVLNEYQWLVLIVTAGGIMYSWGKHRGISLTLDYMREKGKIDWED